MANLKTRVAQLEASRRADPYAGIDPDLWPLVGSKYTHEEWLDIMEREEERKRNEP